MDTLARPAERGNAPERGNGSRVTPLCVDLDGTLLKTDALWETTLANLKAHPWKLLMLPFWLLQGKARFKQRMAEGVTLDCASLPYSEDFLEYLRQAHAEGRELVLVSACDQMVGNQIAQHLGIFNERITSDGVTNLKGKEKARALSERFGAAGFDYAGNEVADFPVWEMARERLAVNTSPQVVSRLEKQ